MLKRLIKARKIEFQRPLFSLVLQEDDERFCVHCSKLQDHKL